MDTWNLNTMGDIDHNGKTHDRLEGSIKELSKSLDNLKENHFAHLSADVTALKTDVTWLKKFFWIVAGASVGSLIANVFNLL